MNLSDLPPGVRARSTVQGFPHRTTATGIGDEKRIPARRGDVVHVLPYPPSVNGMYATVGRRRILSLKGRYYKTSVALLMLTTPKLTGDVALTVNLYRPRRAGDLDNPLKALLDSLTGVAYYDDEQVKEIHAFMHEGRGEPRVEVEVRALNVVIEKGAAK